MFDTVVKTAYCRDLGSLPDAAIDCVRRYFLLNFPLLTHFFSTDALSTFPGVTPEKELKFKLPSFDFRTKHSLASRIRQLRGNLTTLAKRVQEGQPLFIYLNLIFLWTI